jgi:tRNA threonylcarbamoyladenosine biosynthesis protein TsaE
MISWQETGEECLVLLSHSPAGTEQLGCLLAGLCKADTVISLSGDLGAGKTALTRGLARGLGCKGQVASPTFILLMEHPAGDDGLALYHFDVYRLLDVGGSQSFAELGLDEYFTAGGVSVIEWGEGISDLLPPDTLDIRLYRQDSKDEQKREIKICWPGHGGELSQLGRQVRREQEAKGKC